MAEQFEYAIRALKHGLADAEDSLYYARSNIRLLDEHHQIAPGTDVSLVRAENVGKQERAEAEIADINLAIETLLNIQAGIPVIVNDAITDAIKPMTVEELREKFRDGGI